MTHTSPGKLGEDVSRTYDVPALVNYTTKTLTLKNTRFVVRDKSAK